MRLARDDLLSVYTKEVGVASRFPSCVIFSPLLLRIVTWKLELSGKVLLMMCVYMNFLAQNIESSCRVWLSDGKKLAAVSLVSKGNNVFQDSIHFSFLHTQSVSTVYCVPDVVLSAVTFDDGWM